MSLFDKIKKSNKKADEKNIKAWREHPKFNDFFVFGLTIFMIIGIIALSLLIPIGYLTGEVSLIGTILATIAVLVLALYVRWILRYRKRIYSLAFPNSKKVC